MRPKIFLIGKHEIAHVLNQAPNQDVWGSEGKAP
jgi:hypothetical protein